MRMSRALLWTALGLGLAVIYFPLVVVLLNSVNADTTFGWPPSRFTLECPRSLDVDAEPCRSSHLFLMTA